MCNSEVKLFCKKTQMNKSEHKSIQKERIENVMKLPRRKKALRTVKEKKKIEYTEKNSRTKITTETLKIKEEEKENSQESKNITSQSPTHTHRHKQKGKAQKMTVQYTEEKDQKRLKGKWFGEDKDATT